MAYTFLMEDYFGRHPGKHPKALPRTGFAMSTALERGYVAVFEVQDNQLYVRKINRQEGFDKWKDVLPEVFPDQEAVKLDSVTGVLVLGSGHLDFTFGSKSVVLEFDKGDLKKAVRMTGRETLGKFIQRQYEALEKTDEYQARRAELLKIENAQKSQEAIEKLEKASRMTQIFQREYPDVYLKAYNAFVDKINDRKNPVGNYNALRNELLREYVGYEMCDADALIHFEYFKVTYPDEYEKIKPGLQKKYDEYGETLSPYSEDVIRSRLYKELPKLFVD
jgi:hypothetical protein